MDCDFCEEGKCTCIKMNSDLAKASEEKMADVKVCDLKGDAGDCEACGA